jgi:hypothetical protein
VIVGAEAMESGPLMLMSVMREVLEERERGLVENAFEVVYPLA